MRRPGTKVDSVDIIAFCKERIAHYKCPRSIEIRDELPMSGPGNILKRETACTVLGRPKAAGQLKVIAWAAVIDAQGPDDINDKAQAGEASRPSAGLSLTTIATRLPGFSGAS